MKGQIKWYEHPVNEGGVLFAIFSSTANSVNNKFLNSQGVATSDNLPEVPPLSATIKKLVFANQNSSPTGTIEIRKNTTVGTPLISVSLGGFQTEIFDVTGTITAGDKINCKVVSASNVSKPLVKLYL